MASFVLIIIVFMIATRHVYIFMYTHLFAGLSM